jgi:hypothetical protein
MVDWAVPPIEWLSGAETPLSGSMLVTILT